MCNNQQLPTYFMFARYEGVRKRPVNQSDLDQLLVWCSGCTGLDHELTCLSVSHNSQSHSTRSEGFVLIRRGHNNRHIGHLLSRKGRSAKNCCSRNREVTAMVYTDSSAPSEVGQWRIPDLLALKKTGMQFTDNQINFLVRAISDYTMDDYQLGALLMCITLKGMTEKEMVAFTRYTRDSGCVLSWPADWVVVDKHSTGGVGDKVSLALAPALATFGLKVPMISGRGLAHTGGTLDKLESIPGFRVSLSKQEMLDELKEVGCCIVGQTSDIVPADCRMYAARDVTSTVQCIPLIVASILGKKAAESITALVIDVKYGLGALMQAREEAEQLGENLVKVAKSLGIKTTALITNMNAPIGNTIGNALEVREALDCMRGQGPPDLHQLVTHLGGELLVMCGISSSVEEGREAIDRALTDGSARAAFCSMLQKQGVNIEVARSLCGDVAGYHHLPQATYVTPVTAHTSGVVVAVDAMALARVSLQLGSGRSRAGDPINHASGIVLRKVVGDSVVVGEAWAELHHDSPLPTLVLNNTRAALTLDPNIKVFTKSSLISARIA